MRRSRMSGVYVLLAVAVAVLFGVHLALVGAVRLFVHAGPTVISEQAGLHTLSELQQRPEIDPQVYEPFVDAAVPFVEVDAFDDDARDWSNMFSLYATATLVFDANGDGRLDVYFGQDGQNWTRPTDADGVLLDAPRVPHNALYLNQGNDEDGLPVFAQIADLACDGRNDTFVEEELLVEGYLFPRGGCGDPEEGPGRQSGVAVAADLNGDGRLDLLVGNAPPGMFWSHPDTQRVLWQFVSPAGREARHAKQPLTALGLAFLDYEARENRADRRESARGDEPFAANSLYLNLGDADGDGVPEWRDVSREAGIEGVHATASLSVADIDLDGDLDIFAANTMDPDFWPGGSRMWAGGANTLYVSQLAETGTLRFVERAAEMDVDGVYDDDNPMPDYWRLRRLPFLPQEYSFLPPRLEPFQPEVMELNGTVGDYAQISWASTFQDVDDDGYPDLWVANDIGYLRLYLNEQGNRFVQPEHTASGTSGQWMALVPADLDGDLREDLFVGNLGGATFSHAFGGADPFELFDPVMDVAAISSMFLAGKHDTRHVVIDGASEGAERFGVQVRHSAVLPPDASLSNNIRKVWVEPNGLPFDQGSFDPYEFAWGATSLDVQNDGRPDFYYHGGLYGRGGGLSAILGTNPGRLFVNVGAAQDALRFADLTAEHHVFNIHELDYGPLDEHGYVVRPAPTKNWQKRDVVYSYDRSTWTRQGPRLQKHIANADLIQTAEAGRGAIAADVNGDGFRDLLLRNGGGYDSRSSKATNLKIRRDGRAQVLPAHSYHYPVPTQFEPGSSRLFVNRYDTNHWLKVRLVDDSGTLNVDAVGASVVVDERVLQVVRIGDGSFGSNRVEDLLFGLGDAPAQAIEIRWPDQARTVTRHPLDDLSRGTVVISRTQGMLAWEPWGP